MERRLFLILLALTALMMMGCHNVENPDGTFSVSNLPRTYILDSCEYIGYLGFGSADVLAHKGNCRFCKERDSIKWEKRKKELEELIINLKEK